MDADIAIIGGGIAGLSLASCAAPEASVILVEAEPTLGYHATGRSAALYTERYGYGTIRKLAKASRAYLEEAEPKLVTDRGLIFVAPRDDEEALVDLEHELGPTGPWFHRISADEVEALCPIFPSSMVSGGMYEPTAGDIDVDGLQSSFVSRAQAAGATILRSTPVQTVERTSNGWIVGSGDLTVEASCVVNAAGAWGDRVAAMAGVSPLGLTPLLRSVFTFDPGTDPRSWPMIVDARERWYAKPEGPLMIGSAASELPSEPLDARAPEIDVALGIERINAASNLSIRSVKHTWAGLRTFTADRVPAVGFDKDMAGFFWLVGQGGYGIKTSPALGAAAAGLLLHGSLPESVSSFGIAAGDLDPVRLSSR